MDNRDKQEIKSNIKKLDSLTGTGVTGDQGTGLADEFYVFISSGGSGREALVDLKKTLKRKVAEAELREKTLFIAVDSDWNEQDSAVRNGDLDPAEAVKLPYAGAHRLLNPDRISPQTKKWVHPKLWKATGGEDADLTPPDCLGGKGAGSIRQCGRLLFCQSNAQAIYRKSLQRVVNKLSGKNSRKIRVFFLAGLAGGTGSGTVIDLAYLTRYYLKGLLKDNNTKADYYGYLLLPSACGDKAADLHAGNRNAYAALKEIDHYMTVAERNERFVMDYGFDPLQNVDIGENIFDFCTFAENVGADGLKPGNEAEAKDSPSGSDAASVRRVITDSILGILFGKQQYFDTREAQPCAGLPRNANYIYNVLGVSSCIVPVDLLMSYVVKKVLDELFKNLRKGNAVTEDRAVDFIKDCNLDVKMLAGIRFTTKPEKVKQNIEKQVHSEFESYGPYYVISLLRKAAELIENDPFDYLHVIRIKKKSFFTNPFDLWNTKWNKEIAKYEAAIKHFRELNRERYEVYAYILDELRDQIGKNEKVLTELKEYEKVFGKNGRWTPVNFTLDDHNTEAVEKYLERFCRKEESGKLAEEFAGILFARKGDLNGKIDAAERVREFVKEYLKVYIETTAEQFLVISCSGDENAKLSERDKNNKEVPSAETCLAADVLLEKLGAHIYTMASMEAGFPNEARCVDNLILPEEFTWLRRALENRCDNVYAGSEKDRVVLIKRYYNVPAWALTWTRKAEADYKSEGTNALGLHIDQGENSGCAEFPELYPEGKWRGDKK